MTRRPAGFTIVELLAVMLILGTLASAALPLAELSVKRARERELKQALWQIRNAIDAYKEASDTGVIAKEEGASGYPPSLEALIAGVPSKKDGRLLYWLRRVPADPFTKDGAARPGWGLRSYASPAERPQPGADVYDVYSLSPGTGINGLAYQQW